VGDFFRRYPLSTVIGWGLTVLAILTALQGAGILTGRVAHVVNLIAAIVQIALTTIARQKVTPVANPKDDLGRQLVPVRTPPVGGR